MSLDELTNLIDSLQIDSSNNDTLFKKIINLMYEASELGVNNLKYYFQDTTKIQIVIKNLLEFFPDLHIHHTPNTNFIFIDWS
jgi:hypothetical protein